ncbi:MAG: hypothetical protein WDZ93_02520 [Candidatus Paceibacterota bacterium]
MTLITKPTKVTLEGRGTLTLRQSNFVTKGGEGAIYRNGDTIIKLYLDPKKMQRDAIADKIRTLASTLQHDGIVTPGGIVLDTNAMPIGFHMPFVAGEPLPRLFTNDSRAQFNLTDDDARTLAARMYDIVSYTHDRHALMVDANELNWIAELGANGPQPRVIDVDSWAIGKWPAHVIMPSIRDWHSGTFGPLTDWYAWGIVSFQVFTGVHPYKGKLDGYKPGEFERRMRENASVFLPEVRLNRAVRDFTCIPGPLLDWYQETFSSTTRTVPPSPAQSGAATLGGRNVLRVVTTHTGTISYETIFEVQNDPVRSIWPCGVVRLESGALYTVANKRRIGTSTAERLAIVRHDSGWLLAEYENSAWSFRFITRTDPQSHALSLSLACNDVLRSGDRLFAVTDTALVELVPMMFAKPILTTPTQWEIMGNATEWHRGVGIADMLGSMHLIVPFGNRQVAFAKVPELNGMRTIDAVAGTRYVAVLTLDQNGEYRVHGFTFDTEWKQYSVTAHTVDQPDLNIVILPKGVAASIENDGELNVFVPTQRDLKLVRDKDIATTMRLARIDDRVVYRSNGALRSLRMS